ncbi:MAG TPA: PqqD family protein [Chloroflexota bacterium]|nr:PqqD family protein [Chloroflexota bacterium]
MTLKKRADIRVWEVEGEAIMYDPASGMGHVLNPTALRIWSMCDGRPEREIQAALGRDFPESKETIHRDVTGAIKQFKELGLLECMA